MAVMVLTLQLSLSSITHSILRISDTAQSHWLIFTRSFVLGITWNKHTGNSWAEVVLAFFFQCCFHFFQCCFHFTVNLNHSLGIFSRSMTNWDIFLFIPWSQKIGFVVSCKLFAGNVKFYFLSKLFFLFFPENRLTFLANCLGNIKVYFPGNIRNYFKIFTELV